MSNEIFEKEFDKGVIEYGGRPVCLVCNIQFTKLSLSKDKIQRVFMTKKYQNNDISEHEEIDEKLMQIYGNGDSFLLNCYDENEYYSCEFCEKPPRGQGIFSGRIL